MIDDKDINEAVVTTGRRVTVTLTHEPSGRYAFSEGHVGQESRLRQAARQFLSDLDRLGLLVP